MQLQPAVVVTTEAYLQLYPDDTITTRYVVINGCRRLAAAHKYGRTDLEIVVNDEIARDRITLISASIAENVDRQDFDVIEEAKAVERSSGSAAAPTRPPNGCTRRKAWVSQRRALLELAPELQTALAPRRTGDPRGARPGPGAAGAAGRPLAGGARQAGQEGRRRGGRLDREIGRSPVAHRGEGVARFRSKPELLADALHSYLGADGVQRLMALLTQRAARATACADLRIHPRLLR